MPILPGSLVSGKINMCEEFCKFKKLRENVNRASLSATNHGFVSGCIKVLKKLERQFSDGQRCRVDAHNSDAVRPLPRDTDMGVGYPVVPGKCTLLPECTKP